MYAWPLAFSFDIFIQKIASFDIYAKGDMIVGTIQTMCFFVLSIYLLSTVKTLNLINLYAHTKSSNGLHEKKHGNQWTNII